SGENLLTFLTGSFAPEIVAALQHAGRNDVLPIEHAYLWGNAVSFEEIIRRLEHGPELAPTRVGILGQVLCRHRKGENVHGHLRLALGMGCLHERVPFLYVVVILP